MRAYNVKAYAKLNLSLDVGERRDDGYHEMTMIMQTATLCDDVRIERAGEGFTCLTNLRYIPCDERNLAAKAAREFFAAAGLSGGAKLTVTKRIPVGSGMGGGSADAAAVLRGLNAMNGRPFRKAELEEIGARVGSDVPFCIAGGTQLARGRGEILSPLTPLPNCHFVICKPNFSISTPELFRLLDTVPIKCRPDTQGMAQALEAGDLKGVARRMYNVFEDVPDRRHDAIAAIRRELLDCGAMGSIMTGSGSAVFGIFTDPFRALRARDALRRSQKFCVTAANMPAVEV
jgi:4-diphosphocytidyl-2-C-methyl-D-erythritol kinase